MRLELISYLVCAFLSLNISAEGRNPCFCSFFSVKSRLCSEDQTCCKNKYDEMGCCPYKNGICCSGGQCCPADTKCNLDKMRCDFENVNETTHTFVMGSSDQVTNLRILFSPIFPPILHNTYLFCFWTNRIRKLFSFSARKYW